MTCFLWGALSDERWVCHLYMLLSLASAVFLRSEPLGTRDHILLSQIWDFPFRLLLWLAGSRLRYSTPPPHGLLTTSTWSVEWYSLGADHIENTASKSTSIVARGPLPSCSSSTVGYLQSCCLGVAVILLFFCGRCLSTGLYATIFLCDLYYVRGSKQGTHKVREALCIIWHFFISTTTLLLKHSQIVIHIWEILLVAVGNAEVNNKMVSYATVQKVFVSETFWYLLVLVLLWRDNIVEFLFVLHHREALWTDC
jgi:hypothetical protein